MDIEATKVEALDRVAKRRKVSRASLIRNAVDDYLTREQQKDEAFEQAFGAWKDRKIDADAFINALRDEW